MKKQEKIWEARKKKEAELAKLRDKRQTLNKLYGEERGYLRQIATSEKYIRTKAEPRVLWKPKMHNEKTQKAQEESRAALLGDAEERLVQVRETIAKCKTELNESREILSDMRKAGFRENRNQRLEDANMGDDPDVERTPGERGREGEHMASKMKEGRGEKATIKRKRSSEAEEDVDERGPNNTSNEGHNSKAQKPNEEGSQRDSSIAKPKRRRAARDSREKGHDSKDEMQKDERDMVVASTALSTPDDQTIEVEMATLSKDQDSATEGNATSATPMEVETQVDNHESVRAPPSPDHANPGQAEKDSSEVRGGELSSKKTAKPKDSSTDGKETIDEEPKKKDAGEEMPKPAEKGEETPEPDVVPKQVRSDVKIETSPPNVQEDQPANDTTHSAEQPPGASTSDRDPKYADISAWTVKKLRAELAGRGVKHSKIKQKKGLIEALQEELRKPA